MIEFHVMEKPYSCRTKDLLWFQEMRWSILAIVQEGKTIQDIKHLSRTENIFNAASQSRANEICCAISKRIAAVDNDFLHFFAVQNIEIQKLLSVVCVMLEDHTFFEFMDHVYKEKLCVNDLTLKDAEFIGFFHDLQSKDNRAAGWTDAGIRKLKDKYKAILKDGGMITGEGTKRQIIRPILSEDMRNFLTEKQLFRIKSILSGERG